MGATRSLLLHAGFEPFLCRHLQMMPSLSGLATLYAPRWLKRLTSTLWRFNSFLEKIWLVNRLSSNLFLMARKRQVISWRKKPADVEMKESRAKAA